MTNKDVFEKMLPLLADVFGVDENEITPQTNLFGDLYADKMDIIELSMIIEEEFDFLTDDDELAKVTTVAQLCDYIGSHTV